ncbi:MAG TPA: GcrA family cell cycle regulator [Phenylobacterium sp.]|nr:GcrA family cell cycle regulator [Phenylobacterium sp.]
MQARADGKGTNQEYAVRLWKEGYSASQIARLLNAGFSRNAVIGKITRLKLHRGEAYSPSLAGKMGLAGQKRALGGGAVLPMGRAANPKTPRPKPPKPVTIAAARVPPKPQAPTVRILGDEPPLIRTADGMTAPKDPRQTRFVAVPVENPKVLKDLGPCECKFALTFIEEDDLDSQHLFCARRTADEGRPYCPEHQALCWTGAPKVEGERKAKPDPRRPASNQRGSVFGRGRGYEVWA